ncbi:MAG: metalloregulator ArsR/SmtB family transcription factor, partial [Pseudolysinimonas sp.]
MDVQRAMAAIAEPTRYRIVLLLNEAPHTVGEVAAALGALQPQTTKHLQALEQAGVVVVHRLGRRRVAALHRENLGRLADWVSALTEKLPDEEALERYSRSIAAEPTDAGGERRVVFRRLLPAPADRVWRAWTVPEQLEQWWAPRHFVLAHQDFVPIAGHEIEMVLREGDGAEYRAVGRMLRVDTGRLLEFTLPPIGADGAPLFA